MEPLKPQRIFKYAHDYPEIEGDTAAGLPISKKPCHKISTYEELLEKVSSLNFYNPSLQIVFRGQNRDYYSKNDDGKPVRSNLYPSLLRSLPIAILKRQEQIRKRVDVLEKAESLLKERLKVGYIHKHRLVRWAILQHYEICQTPLLDVTNSLQTALSFALNNNRNEGYLYVLGLPYSTGPITVSVESMTQIVDLSKLCPPEAARPHFQHGLLIGDYPIGLDSEELVKHSPRVSANFSCRLLTKFHLSNTRSWVGKLFTPIPQEVLFPNSRDKWYPILHGIKNEIST